MDENNNFEVDYFDVVDDYDNIIWPEGLRLPKVYIRDKSDPFNVDFLKFTRKYRFCQESVFFIVNEIRSGLMKPDQRGLPIAPEIAVLLTLRFYATASFQIVCGDLLEISQPTASIVIMKVSTLLATLMQRYIKFPAAERATSNRELFKEMGRIGRWPGLPGVDGAIDCTHIKIVSTPGCEHHEVYRNRKSYFSINVQAIVGPNTEFLDVVARWAGSTHDSRIFQMSRIFMKYSTGALTGRLVGDSGYPTLPFVLTPIRPPPEDRPGSRYNRAQAKTRNVVERTFGIWKRRYPCLSRGLGNKLGTVNRIIVACAVLHNIALRLNDVIDFEEPDENNTDQDDDDADDDEDEAVIPSTSSGFIIRRSIIEINYS